MVILLNYMEEKSDEVNNVLKTVKGITDLGVIRNIGQPELDIDLDQGRMALYGVIPLMLMPLLKWPLVGKLSPNCMKIFVILICVSGFRLNSGTSDDDIGNLQVPTASGSKVPVNKLQRFHRKQGPV